MTYQGPVFVDSRGMTLYTSRVVKSCGDKPQTVRRILQPDVKVDFPIPLPDADHRRSCADKYPPLIAPDDAKPLGKWSVQTREDGRKQWAYEGHALHLSFRDKEPGDVNGAVPLQLGLSFMPWNATTAPLPGAPPNVTTRITFAGVALALGGKTLYYADNTRQLPVPALWQPMLAPEVAVVNGDGKWSIVQGASGKQWAYDGKPLYTYALDSVNAEGFQYFGDIFGGLYGRPIKGWHILLLQGVPPAPHKVTVQTGTDMLAERSAERKIYADGRGMTLYTLECIDDSVDLLDCDDVGDSPLYWTSFCGGEDRCQTLWHPFAAAASDKSINNVWTVITINPRNPLQRADSAGVRVWAYRGKPLFTYAGDDRPGEVNGEPYTISVRSQMMASTVPAYTSNAAGIY
jgi:predicted lipoprotein with Yx(FWY)xxD motif